MRDVSQKYTTLRTASARAVLLAAPATIARLRADEIPKGDPLPVARVAAVLAVKNVSQIIPFCHPLPIEHVDVHCEVADDRITVDVDVKAVAKTGVEMEALTGAAVAALTLYDMMKMLDQSMRIISVELLEKHGGKSDFQKRKLSEGLRAAVLVMSDSIAAGRKEDASGKLIAEQLEQEGVEVVDYRIISDDRELIEKTLTAYADEDRLNLVVTTGGTGFGPRDTAPEAMRNIVEREAPGISEAARAYGQERTPYSMLSRGRTGIRGHTLIVNLPGSRKGVSDSLDALFPGLLHAFKMLRGEGHEDDRGREVKG
jgi:molybdenum cofactor biosynthesis protein MoaC